MRQREHVVQNRRLIVHKNVRIAVEGTTTERAALLALVWIAITPSPVQSSLKHITILTAKWLQSVDDYVRRLLPRVLRFQVTQNGHVGVIVMNRFQLHLSATKVVVSMQRR